MLTRRAFLFFTGSSIVGATSPQTARSGAKQVHTKPLLTSRMDWSTSFLGAMEKGFRVSRQKLASLEQI